MNNQEVLAAIDAAVKNITDVSAMGESILSPAQRDRFVRAMQHKTTILPEARFINMEAQQVNIDRIAFIGRVLRAGQDEDGNHRNLHTSEYAKPQTETNKLVAKELVAVLSLQDKALRRNIEQGNLETTLIELLGQAAGRDMEEFALLADENIDPADDLMLSLVNAWLKRAANKIYGQGDNKDFDVNASSYPENLFQAMINALPKQYLQTRNEWRIWCSFEVEDAYRDLLKARGTALGDTALTTANQLTYKGLPIKYCPIIERSNATGEGGAGQVALLGHPDNLAWGVFHEVTIEREREAKKRQTDFVLTFEGDADYEDENAAVAAFIDQEDSASTS